MLCALNREYERDSVRREHIDPFARWLQLRCEGIPEGVSEELDELRALSIRPSQKVCSFRSMMSHGSHYRVEGEEAGGSHVTYDSGVAELQACRRGSDSTNEAGFVDLIRVGTLKDILVFDHVHMNVVLMVVSWVAKHTDNQPRMRRDGHGFWLANLAATPRSSDDPYILPSLASQVPIPSTMQSLRNSRLGCGTTTSGRLRVGTHMCRYFSCKTRQSQGGVLCCRRRPGGGE